MKDTGLPPLPLAGASLAGWDLADTATQWCPVPSDRLTRLSAVRPVRTPAR
jgi:hypothetical protein